MAGPFPGMDPYIEAQGNWQDFHNSLIAAMREVLGAHLPHEYVARVDERVDILGWDESLVGGYLPDVLIARADVPRSSGPGGAPVATIEPTLIEVAQADPEEVRHTWVEVRRLPHLELITVVEVLSPVNKAGAGRVAYLEKRDALHAQKVNLVEIDLLLGGAQLPMKRPLPVGDYFAIVARGEKLPMAEVYGWSVRSPLPSVPVPLRPPDPDVAINLGELVDRVYDLGRYGRTLRHDQPLPATLPIRADDRTWSERLGQGPATPPGKDR